MTVPPTRIGKLNVKARPLAQYFCPLDIEANRPNNRYDDFRPELEESSRQARFASDTSAAAYRRLHFVNRLPTQIDKVTAKGMERLQKIGRVQDGKCGNEGVPYSPVESGICLVEKSAGRGRSLAHE